MIETLLISGGIAAMTAIGVKAGRFKRDADRFMSNELPIMVETFRAESEIDQIYMRASDQIRQAERRALS